MSVLLRFIFMFMKKSSIRCKTTMEDIICYRLSLNRIRELRINAEILILGHRVVVNAVILALEMQVRARRPAC